MFGNRGYPQTLCANVIGFSRTNFKRILLSRTHAHNAHANFSLEACKDEGMLCRNEVMGKTEHVVRVSKPSCGEGASSVCVAFGLTCAVMMAVQCWAACERATRR